MVDPYCYEDTPVLRNTLDIRDEKTLDLIEAEQSRANMMLLYEQGFHDFTPEGLRNIHRFLFGDIYQWAGEYRIINIAKREKLLAGRSVWYSNDDAIADDLVAVPVLAHGSASTFSRSPATKCRTASMFFRNWGRNSPWRE